MPRAHLAVVPHAALLLLLAAAAGAAAESVTAACPGSVVQLENVTSCMASRFNGSDTVLHECDLADGVQTNASAGDACVLDSSFQCDASNGATNASCATAGSEAHCNCTVNAANVSCTTTVELGATCELLSGAVRLNASACVADRDPSGGGAVAELNNCSALNVAVSCSDDTKTSCTVSESGLSNCSDIADPSTCEVSFDDGDGGSGGLAGWEVFLIVFFVLAAVGGALAAVYAYRSGWFEGGLASSRLGDPHQYEVHYGGDSVDKDSARLAFNALYEHEEARGVELVFVYVTPSSRRGLPIYLFQPEGPFGRFADRLRDLPERTAMLLVFQGHNGPAVTDVTLEGHGMEDQDVRARMCRVALSTRELKQFERGVMPTKILNAFSDRP